MNLFSNFWWMPMVKLEALINLNQRFPWSCYSVIHFPHKGWYVYTWGEFASMLSWMERVAFLSVIGWKIHGKGKKTGGYTYPCEVSFSLQLKNGQKRLSLGKLQKFPQMEGLILKQYRTDFLSFYFCSFLLTPTKQKEGTSKPFIGTFTPFFILPPNHSIKYFSFGVLLSC